MVHTHNTHTCTHTHTHTHTYTDTHTPTHTHSQTSIHTHTSIALFIEIRKLLFICYVFINLLFYYRLVLELDDRNFNKVKIGCFRILFVKRICNYLLMHAYCIFEYN